MPEFFSDPGGYLAARVGRVAASALVVVLVFGARYAARRLGQSFDGPEHSRTRLLISGLAALTTALGVVAIIGVWGLFRPLVRSFDDLGLSQYVAPVVLALILVAGAYSITGFIHRAIQEFASGRGRVSEHQREVLYRVTQVTLYAIVGLVIISLFTNDPSSLLVGAGFLGIVVGMAARQTLGAVLAGFVLMFSRPFEIGDWVEIGDHEGVVTDITIVNTRIQTFDGEYVMLPNDNVSGNAITNRTRRGRLRIEVEVGVDYDADPERAAAVATDAVEDVDSVLSVPRPQVVLKSFADSAVLLGIRVWIDNPSARRMWRARTAVIAAVKEAFDAEGIKIPFPQRELAGRAEEGGLVLAGGPAADAEAPQQPAPDGGENGTESERR
jgi:small-conductance mechanosensitive channel